jgi:hypothetical protein
MRRWWGTVWLSKSFLEVILDHMERHNLFTTHQHGFRKGRSCVTQLIEVLDDWTKQHIFLAVSCKNCGCIWSGPDDLVTFSFSRCFCTVSELNLIVDSFSSVLWSNVTPLQKKGPNNLVIITVARLLDRSYRKVQHGFYSH